MNKGIRSILAAAVLGVVQPDAPGQDVSVDCGNAGHAVFHHARLRGDGTGGFIIAREKTNIPLLIDPSCRVSRGPR